MIEALSAFLRVLVQPAQVYPMIRERRPLLWPIVIVLVTTALAGAMLIPAIRETLARQIAERPDLPAEAAAFATTFGVWTAVVGGAVSSLIYILVTAGILALGMLFTSGSLPYRHALSLTLFAYAPLVLRSLILGGLVVAGALTDLRQAVTSAAVLLPPEQAGTVLYRVLNLIDPLEWWHVGLIAGGVQYVADANPRAAWTLAVISWLLLYGGVKLLAPAA